MRKTAYAFIAMSMVAGVAAADTGLHISTDIVTWDKPLTEAQCLEKAKAAIIGATPKLTTTTANHAWVGTKSNWVIAVDCLQSYKLNGAYVTIVFTGDKTDEFEKVKPAVSKALGGKSELYK